MKNVENDKNHINNAENPERYTDRKGYPLYFFVTSSPKKATSLSFRYF